MFGCARGWHALGGLLAAFVAQRYIVNVRAATPARRDLRVVLVVALLASVVTAFAVLFRTSTRSSLVTPVVIVMIR